MVDRVKYGPAGVALAIVNCNESLHLLPAPALRGVKQQPMCQRCNSYDNKVLSIRSHGAVISHAVFRCDNSGERIAMVRSAGFRIRDSERQVNGDMR